MEETIGREEVCKIVCRIFVDEDEKTKRSSYEEHTEDALVHGAEEGRDKLRKAAGRSKYLVIRRYPNEETQCVNSALSAHESIVCGGEPGELKHLITRRKRK